MSGNIRFTLEDVRDYVLNEIKKELGLRSPATIKLNPGAIIPVLLSPEQQKHEEIKRMAWEIYVRKNSQMRLEFHIGYTVAWELAEKFYKFAKEKEGAK